jgi:hypothetical protein
MVDYKTLMTTELHHFEFKIKSQKDDSVSTPFEHVGEFECAHWMTALFYGLTYDSKRSKLAEDKYKYATCDDFVAVSHYEESTSEWNNGGARPLTYKQYFRVSKTATEIFSLFSTGDIEEFLKSYNEIFNWRNPKEGQSHSGEFWWDGRQYDFEVTNLGFRHYVMHEIAKELGFTEGDFPNGIGSSIILYNGLFNLEIRMQKTDEIILNAITVNRSRLLGVKPLSDPSSLTKSGLLQFIEEGISKFVKMPTMNGTFTNNLQFQVSLDLKSFKVGSPDED